MGKFENKVVIVTGSSSGIGAATAIAFAKEGAKLAIHGRNEERLNKTVKLCEKEGAEVLKIIADLLVFENLESIIKQTVERFSTIDILINNAGEPNPFRPIKDFDLDSYELKLNVNLRAPVFLCKYAYPHLEKTKECAPVGIRVNCIIPAGVNSGMIDRITSEEHKQGIIDWVDNTHSLGMIPPESIADGIMYLCSAQQVTGTSLVIDSGSLHAS